MIVQSNYENILSVWHSGETVLSERGSIGICSAGSGSPGICSSYGNLLDQYSIRSSSFKVVNGTSLGTSLGIILLWSPVLLGGT